MIENKSVLRKWDFISSIILILFSLWIIFESLKMPLGNEVVNGVKSEWFTSPALMPLIVGTAILLMSISLMIVAVKEGAIELLKKGLIDKDSIDMNQTYRSLAIYYAIFGFVFFLISYIDYYISIMLFLAYLITLFYVEKEDFWQPLAKSYLVFTLAFFILNLVGVFKSFAIFADILAIAYIIYIAVYAAKRTKEDKVNRKKFKISFLVSFIMSAFICSIFTFVLMVTPPRQGGIIMSPAENVNALIRDLIRGEDPDAIDLDSIDLDSIDTSNNVDVNSLLGN